MMKNLLLAIIVVIGVGIIDTIEDKVVSVELTKPKGGETLIEDISKFPCEVREGDAIIVVDVGGTRIYKCITQQECKKKL